MQNSLSSICSRAIEYLFYALFFFVPLIFLPVTSELFEFNKMILTYAITVLIGGFWAVKMVISGQFRVQRTPLDIPILLFLASQVISTILSIDPHTSIWGYYSRSNGGLLSIISYIFLYYAFVSNLAAGSKENKEQDQFAIKKKFFIPAVVMLIIGFFGLILVTILERYINVIAELVKLPPVYLVIKALAYFYLAVSFPFQILKIPIDLLVIIILYLILTFFLFLFSFRGPFIKRLFTMILISGAIVAFYGVFERFGIDAQYWVQDVQNRVFSTLGQPNWLAAYLSVLIPISLAFVLGNQQTAEKNPGQVHNAKFKMQNDSVKSNIFNFKLQLLTFNFVLLTSLFYLTLLYTKSRSGFAGLWVGLLFFIGFLFLSFRAKSRNLLHSKTVERDPSTRPSDLVGMTKRMYWYLLAVFAALSMVTFLVGSPFEQINKFTLRQITNDQQLTTKVQGPALETGGTESGEIRKIVWQGAIDIARHYPLFGSGVETFAYSYYQYRPVEHNLTSEWDFLYNKAHNEYLNYLATTGVFGLGSYFIMIITFIIFILKKRLFNNLLALGLVAAYISILVSNFFGFSVVIINLFFFLIPAMAFVLSGQLNIQHSFIFPKVPSLSKAKMENFQWLLIILVLVASGYLLVAIYTVWSADTDYAVGKQYNRAGEYKQAHDYLVNARQRRPDEPLFADELAVNNAALALISLEQNQSTAAAKFAKEAVRQSTYAIGKSPNNPGFWRSRIRVFTALSQMDEKYYEDALEAVQKSIELSPTDPEILYNYALILAQTGNIEEAIEQLKKSQALKPDYREPVYALGILYHEMATDKDDKVINQDYLNLAILQMEKLVKIASTDSQAKEKLLEWKRY